ncbi:hypothetical protein ANOM_008909 [Aspergillus nomiae NRRL 13137]|uniref:Uncharacterized protein n=1 Tax=Aspergillus nomiae NRRL (strain ATCC 15546 / NRRL 13137 / CBS 260.88 / M93) TaxID=1509407 RepID=A0A0L1IS31_ASPN3|nr:uncharacterized protein ANOM_008909 [Aspergillus nomiae NRRL 13137]KNG82391.1 hypothetical protein ANOM_008909 [Aspergillus nomiae NRRL 13137]
MATKRPASPDVRSDQPTKKVKVMHENQEWILDEEEIPTTPSSPLSPSETNDSSADAETLSESSGTDSVKPSPYTDEFFADMANIIANLFPFEAFAKAHGCTVGDVSQAISAMVVAPLSDPSFTWHSDSEISIAEYGRGMISIWNEHYERKLRNTDTTKLNIDLTTPKCSTSSSGIETPSEDGSVLSESFNKALLGETSSEDEVEPPDSEAPGLSKKSCLSTQSQKAARRPAKRVRWAPPLSPVVREKVYKDDYGNYVPVPTPEEIKEKGRKKLREEVRASKGLLERPEPTYSAFDLEVLANFDDLEYVV